MQEKKHDSVYVLFTCLTILFTYLKIILLQYFQFSVSAMISLIQTKQIQYIEFEFKFFTPT